RGAARRSASPARPGCRTAPESSRAFACRDKSLIYGYFSLRPWRLRLYDPRMPARALGSATIAFGLGSIPVKLYSAAESAATVRFNQIDRRDGGRIKQQLISSNSGEVVPREEIVKGYEFAKGQYVLFSPDEIKALEVAATHMIDIDQFLPDG